jgi:predicted transcriptional regulator
MNVGELISIVKGQLLVPDADLNHIITGGCGADLMSDVLASIQQTDGVLLTGLCNPQIVRTAVMADLAAIVLVRGKIPPQETIALAQQEQIPLITTPFGMFELCGRLFNSGLSSLEKPISAEECDCG